ncbi:MAG TPA: hypothetical protein VFS60_15235 [Thermoanaerobaculia bacterium]|nr:hypothetical protein [Thermoanaerobaculia bacterium]
MLKKILWVEDGAEAELFNMLAPIYVTGLYDLTIAANATEAVERLEASEFAAVIVDIRLPPGRDPQWVDIYGKYHENRDAARLGLHLLRALFAPGSTSIRLSSEKKEWIVGERFAVFSVETDLANELREMGIGIYEQKNARTPRTKVLEIIRRLANASKG